MTKNQNNPNKSVKGTPKEVVFGWKHLLIRATIVAVISSFLSYLQAIEVINVAGNTEAQLLVPAITGLLLVIVHFKLLRPLAIIFIPLWFAAAVAIEVGGAFLAAMVNNGFQEYMNPVLDIIVQYLPAAISGHWLYSGYSRFSRSTSILVYWLVVGLSVFIAFLFYTDFEINLIEAIYLSLAAYLLSYMHMGKTLKWVQPKN
jgi:hypothetical protein